MFAKSLQISHRKQVTANRCKVGSGDPAMQHPYVLFLLRLLVLSYSRNRD
jgi:hypothetical protein